MRLRIRSLPTAIADNRTACPLRARSDGKSGRFTATHGQTDTPPTCVGLAQTTRTRSLLSSGSRVRILPGARRFTASRPDRMSAACPSRGVASAAFAFLPAWSAIASAMFRGTVQINESGPGGAAAQTHSWRSAENVRLVAEIGDDLQLAAESLNVGGQGLYLTPMCQVAVSTATGAACSPECRREEVEIVTRVAGWFGQCAPQESWTERVGASQPEDRGLAAEPTASPTIRVDV